MGTQFNAAGSLLGYLYQCRVALLLTLRKTKRDPGLHVWIERFDDVSFESSGSPSERVQTKHHISRSGSLSDRETNPAPSIGPGKAEIVWKRVQ
jgi:hypothetical protein